MKRDVIELPIDQVVVKRLVRGNYGDLQSLAASIRKLGVIYPIMVDRNSILICGSRRLEACRELGLATIPAVKLDIDYTDIEALELQSDANLCRLPLTSAELETLIGLKKDCAAGAQTQGLMSGIRKVFSHG